MADGCLSRRIGPYKTYRTVILSLNNADRAHVCKFRDFMQSENVVVTTKVHRTTFGSCQTAVVCLSSERVVDRLIELGITYRKTDTAVAHEDLAKSRDFWRGFIDGDGTVSTVVNRGVPYPAIAVGGTAIMMDQLKVFLEDNIPGICVKIGVCRSIRRVGFNGLTAQEVVRLLYFNASTSLDRKMQKAQEILSWAPRFPKMVKSSVGQEVFPLSSSPTSS